MQKQNILALLKRKSKVYNSELNKIAFRYSARIEELRKEGYEIETIREGLGWYSFKLIREPKKVK